MGGYSVHNMHANNMPLTTKTLIDNSMCGTAVWEVLSQVSDFLQDCCWLFLQPFLQLTVPPVDWWIPYSHLPFPPCPPDKLISSNFFLSTGDERKLMLRREMDADVRGCPLFPLEIIQTNPCSDTFCGAEPRRGC